jgi:hypothetical protein
VLPGSPARRAVRSHAVDQISVNLGALELSCERGAQVGSRVTLVPCYSDLVAALRGRTAEFHGALTTSFAQLVPEFFVGRISASALPPTS